MSAYAKSTPYERGVLASEIEHELSAAGQMAAQDWTKSICESCLGTFPNHSPQWWSIHLAAHRIARLESGLGLPEAGR